MTASEKCPQCGCDKAPRVCYECGHHWEACACHVLPEFKANEQRNVQSVPICPECESLAVSQ